MVHHPNGELTAVPVEGGDSFFGGLIGGAGAGDLKLHELDPLRGDAALAEKGFGEPEFLEFGTGEIDAIHAEIFGDIAEDVGELHGFA